MAEQALTLPVAQPVLIIVPGIAEATEEARYRLVQQRYRMQEPLPQQEPNQTVRAAAVAAEQYTFMQMEPSTTQELSALQEALLAPVRTPAVMEESSYQAVRSVIPGLSSEPNKKQITCPDKSSSPLPLRHRKQFALL